jgi:hypothetical protein
MAQGSDLPPQEVHDRIVAILSRNARRPIPPGDTLVTWSPIPNLYTTVARSAGAVASSLVRVDSMVGTAYSQWAGGRQSHVSIHWTQGDSTLIRLEISVDSAHLTLTGSRSILLDVPTLPWAIADYGMEDQVLPLYEGLPASSTVALYRPYPAKWDTLSVKIKRLAEGTVIRVTHRDGEEFQWIVSPNGVLIRLTRSKYPNFERRPLEQTERMQDYRLLRGLAEPA